MNSCWSQALAFTRTGKCSQIRGTSIISSKSYQHRYKFGDSASYKNDVVVWSKSSGGGTDEIQANIRRAKVRSESRWTSLAHECVYVRERVGEILSCHD